MSRGDEVLAIGWVGGALTAGLAAARMGHAEHIAGNVIIGICVTLAVIIVPAVLLERWDMRACRRELDAAMRVGETMNFAANAYLQAAQRGEDHASCKTQLYKARMAVKFDRKARMVLPERAVKPLADICAQLHNVSSGPGTTSADGEDLRRQLDHAQRRVVELEQALADLIEAVRDNGSAD